MLKQRSAMIENGEKIDWGMAEALAFGSILYEGKHVRLSGQDCERGTFSHRHSVLHDQEDESIYVPLNNLRKGQGYFEVVNSSLSEFGVLGFELGYSMEDPRSLILWEAQFGDFANEAQVIFDQFIASQEQKWRRQTGLVCLLPHGYDGQGPEHSSARIERFLQLHDEDPRVVPPMKESERRQIQLTNMQIVNCSTPANYFHVLRRQLNRDFRKPLIVFTPKRLLRYKYCVSTIDDFGPKTRFRRAIPDPSDAIRELNPKEVRRLVFCSGQVLINHNCKVQTWVNQSFLQVYYDLFNERSSRGAVAENVALVRLEQVAPFPWDHVQEQLERFPNAEVTWCQEEPLNMGAYHFFKERFETVTKHLGTDKQLSYAGRDPAAAPSTGYLSQHERELKDLLDAALR